MELETPKLQVYRGWFPADVCTALHGYILTQTDRKMEHPLDDPTYQVPTPITDALPFVPFLSGGNVAVTKRHEHTEGSGAFTLHRDPARFNGRPLALCTLGGRAVLSVTSDERDMIEIDCTSNTVVVAHDNPMHVVTPPVDEEVRTFMFVGSDPSLPDVLSNLPAVFTTSYTQ